MNVNERWHINTEGITLAGRRLPVTRGQLMMLFVAINLIFLGVDILLAHGMNGNIRWNEWIPIIFGPVAGVILLIAGAVSLRQRSLAIWLAFAVLAVSFVIGLLGAYFHIERAIPPDGLNSNTLVFLLVFAPPIIGPLTFTLVAILGVIAAVYEDPPNSGRMVIPGIFSWQVPFSKTQQYSVWVGLGILSTLLSSVLDHGRTNFENPWTWLPIIVGVFATVVTVIYGLVKDPDRSDTMIYIVAMVLLLVVGMIGFVLHVETDLTTRGIINPQRFLRGAPFLAPLLFADMAMLGLVAIIPVEEKHTSDED